MDRISKNTEREPLLSFSTRIINTRFANPDIYGAISQPIYRNAAFEFPDSQTIADAFQYRTDLHTYSRISNPTVANFEEKIKTASGAGQVMALASGMAAISNTFLTLAYAGANIVASPHLFGNTFSFLQSTLSGFGVETRFVNTDDLQEITSAIDQNTCAFFAEVITNPHLEVADLPEISKILRNKNIPVIIDTTVIPWCGFDARKAGIDIEVISTTKYISGGATGIGGVIVDHDTCDWKANKKLGSLPKPKGMSRFMFKLRSEIARNIGACMSADTAAMQSLGMESLELRYKRMSGTAYGLALHLSKQNKISEVNYPGLDSSPYKAVSDRLFSDDPGAMFTVTLDSKEACYKFMDALKVIRRATNLFDNKTLVIHPSSTIYGAFSPEMKKIIGIKDNLIRFSIGLEDIDDLKKDIGQALDSI
ncbi:MAG: aminotransferase class V-fold PLP-dependent enzyme [Prevotella sp.]|jgi:O-acetylhomoserine (thiol)-lyase|nr:aminotransferase class V-fold PLP-dependent enzyme [Prevotella sp.]